jgi:NADP-dependent 3-hydroxy acid dehydrogenase YdfG
MPFTSMIALNITAVTALSKAALARFQERDSGTIVNIGSGVGFAPLSWVPVYGPTKAYASRRRHRRRLLQSPSRPRIAIFALLISVGTAGET